MYIAFVGKNCITETEEFGAVCLAEVVLRVALVAIKDLRDEQVSNNNIYLLQGNSDDQTVHIKLEKNNFAGIHFHGLGKKSIYLGDLFSRKNQPRPRAFFLHIRHSAKYEGKTPWERGWRKKL